MTVLEKIRQAPSFPAVADAVLASLGRAPGVVAVAVIGLDVGGKPVLWIGDGAPEAIRAFLAGGTDPHEVLAIARGGALRAIPFATGSAIAGVIQLVITGDRPSWSDLALIGAQVSARLATLGIDAPLADHVEPIRLSDRQREIAYLVARGCTNAEIGRMLGISANTVKQQVSQLLALFDVTNRTELAALATRWSSASNISAREIYVRASSQDTA